MATEETQHQPTDAELVAKQEEARRQSGTLPPDTSPTSALTRGKIELHRVGPGVRMSPEEARAFEIERNAHRIRVRGGESGLPDEYLVGKKSFATFPSQNKLDSAAIVAAKEWVKSIGARPSLLLSGPLGVGKSGLAQCAIATLLRIYRARFINFVDLMMEVNKSFRDDETSEADVVDSLKTIDRIAIDDIDKVKVSEHVLKTLWTIVDYRYRHELPTIFTSNATLEQLFDVFAVTRAFEVTAGSIVDRLRGMCVTVEMTGGSKR